jgi:hypothetical protein
VADKESNFRFIAEDRLAQIGMTKADVIKNLPEGIPPRSIYAYFQRGQGAIELAAVIAEAMGCTLNDIYVPAETGAWASAAATPRDTEKDESSQPDAIMEALLARGDYNTLMLAANAVSRIGLFSEGKKLIARASELKNENGGDDNAE